MKLRKKEKTLTMAAAKAGTARNTARGLSRNGVKNYSKGPCVTILE